MTKKILQHQKIIPKTIRINQVELNNNSLEASRQPLIEHLHELRRRSITVAIFVVIGGILGYNFHQKILDIIIKPLGQPLYYTTPGGGFDLVFKISVYFGILFATPVFLYNFFNFIHPAINKISKFFFIKIFISSLLLILAGILFAYFVTLPAALHFLNDFTTDEIRSLITTNSYLSFTLIYIFGFAILFQLPIFLIFVNKIHTLKFKTLFKKQKYIILLSFIAAAIITPTPDIFNQAVMALPIIFLYELSIIVIFFINKKGSH